MPNPLLCVTVTAPTMAALREERDRVADADLVELRLDTVRDPDVAGALEGRRRPVIVTCRAGWEGGGFLGAEEERRRLLGQARDQGAEYVDIEWKAGFDDLIARAAGKRIVLSSHHFSHVPPDLGDLTRAMRATGAEVIKIAAKVNSLGDCLPLLELGAQRPNGSQRAVFIAMGEAGLSSRVLAGRFGSAWTYAGAIRDVGQVSADELLGQYRFRAIGPSTAVYGLAGSPIGHSVSPAMHNAAFAAERLDAVYLPLPATDAADFMRFAGAIGLQGASVTIPFKVSLFGHVSEVDEIARRIGAINTLRLSGDRWLGRNTDAQGFLEPLLARGVPLVGRRASILGAGGSARSVAVALATEGADVTVHGRDPAKAARMADAVGARVGDWPPPSGTWDLLVNCTPIGMHPRVDESPVPHTSLGGGLVYDLVYNPSVTRLLREAAAAGAQTIGGLDMLVAQAGAQFEWWTGRRPMAGIMRAAALKRLSEFKSDEDHVV